MKYQFSLKLQKKIHNKNIVFLIWGDGDERTNLEKKVISECVHNVLFKGRVEKKYIPYILSKADLNIAHNKPSSVLQYGVSFNKIFDYFAAGKPIICDFPSNSNPVIIHKAGIELKEATIENIANAIDEMFSSKSSMSYYAHNARATAEQCYNYEKLSSKMLSILNQVIGFNSK